MNMTERKQSFWISLEILSWDVFPEGGSRCGEKDSLIDRPYHLLRHAEDKITPTSSELDLIDAITTLKRAAFHRKAALEKIYELRQIPLSDLPKDPLERLAFFGLIRPMVLRTLIDIRNNIEHSDGRPPGVDRCKEMAEYIWYFLRSTDPLVRLIPDMYVLGTTDSDYPEAHWVEVEMGPEKNWMVQARGWLPDKLVSLSGVEGWCLIEGSMTRAGEQLRPNDRDRNSNDAFINGKVLGPRESLLQFYRHYFSQI